MKPLDRRAFLDLAAKATLVPALLPTLLPAAARAATPPPPPALRKLDLAGLKAAPSRVNGLAGEKLTDVVVARDWQDARCRARVTNTGKTPVKIREVVLFELAHELPP